MTVTPRERSDWDALHVEDGGLCARCGALYPCSTRALLDALKEAEAPPKEPERPAVTVYRDPDDWWIGYYRGLRHHYVCPLPTLMIRWPRRRPLS